MLRTSARLLRLVALLQSRRYWSGKALSERLEVDVRTVRRDVDRLRELGYPVRAATGVGGGYQLGAGAELPPVLLEDDEAVAVAVALRAAAGSIGGLDDTAARLLAKLDQLLPARLRKRASALHAVMLSLGEPQSRPAAEVLTRTAAACRDHECLQFRYRNHQNRTSLRDVEPLRLANYGRRWYLAAWDRARTDWRTFRVDRMEAPLATGKRFVPREPPEGLSQYLLKAISHAPHEQLLRLRLNSSAEQAAQCVPRWVGTIEAVDADHCMLTTGADSPEFLLAQLAVVGVDFELDDPPAQTLQGLYAALARLNRALMPMS